VTGNLFDQTPVAHEDVVAAPVACPSLSVALAMISPLARDGSEIYIAAMAHSVPASRFWYRWYFPAA